ncbi:F-BAR and double SH3 domains protein 2-like [Protopterus annectens]|uniref:F-BAR and double SH3 domains protein 2-like n=1 Tax=Protopterus annectens TaxID=7888 RepID=UPI001CFC4651|nr:F-BAR and double SH3 domains protein 2-like [Protopterus annectens]
MIIESTNAAGQARVTASENFRNLGVEIVKTVRAAKEQRLKKYSEQLLRIQMELMQTMKELDQAKKRYSQQERIAEIAREKAADADAKHKKNDYRIFQSKSSLQKLNAKLSARVTECNMQLTEARNEYLLTLSAVTAHHEHYHQTDLPVTMKGLDGDLYDRLKEHFTFLSETEITACQSTLEHFQRSLEFSRQISRDYNLQLFLKENPVLITSPAFRFEPSGTDQVNQLQKLSGSQGEACNLEKEARKWASRSAKDFKIKAHAERALQSMGKKGKSASEQEQLSLEQKMDEVHECIRKAQINKLKADARLGLMRQCGVNVDTWLASAMMQANEELEHERKRSEARILSNGEPSPEIDEFDLTEFDDFDDVDDTFEEGRSSPVSSSRSYPLTCRVLYSYQGTQADELSICQDEELDIIEDGDMEDWVKARNKAGQIGYVPEKYLSIPITSHSLQLSACAFSDSTSNASSNSMEMELRGSHVFDQKMEGDVCLARALYDYEGQTAEELSFLEGAIIRVLNKCKGGVDDGFWEGEFNGRMGVFPSLMVEEITGDDADHDQEPHSPSPPVFSLPAPGMHLLRVESGSHGTLVGSTQEGRSSTQNSPELALGRIRPMRAAPPPPAKSSGNATDSEEHFV